jgi:hypothetical protein
VIRDFVTGVGGRRQTGRYQSTSASRLTQLPRTKYVIELWNLVKFFNDFSRARIRARASRHRGDGDVT